MNDGVKMKAHRPISAVNIFSKSGPLSLLKNNDYALSTAGRKKKMRESKSRASDLKRIKGSFKCMAYRDRSTHPLLLCGKQGATQA